MHAQYRGVPPPKNENKQMLTIGQGLLCKTTLFGRRSGEVVVKTGDHSRAEDLHSP